ncbi:unknown [Clostridium sp. CAG:417]|nr:unknown [Clostridium sp. CAG:417]
MTKITINIKMDDKFDIALLNENSKNKKEIKFSDKNINAYDIYELFDYKKDNNYQITSNIDQIEDGNEKDYFLEVINLIDSIIKEINELNNDKQHIEEKIQSNENELFSDLN